TQDLDPPALSVVDPSVLTCKAPMQTLTGSSSAGGIQFSWASIVGTDTTMLGNGATLLVSSPGTYFLFGLNPVNNCVNSTSIFVSADQSPPIADAGSAFTLDCGGETAPLNGSGSGGLNLSYQWTSADGHFVSGAGSPTPLIDKAGTYVLELSNTVNGCTDTDEVTILPEIPEVYASVIQPSCQDEQGTVIVDTVTGLSAPILYSLNNSLPGTQTQFDQLIPGSYTIQVSGGNGCTASATVYVDAAKPIVITLDPTATIALGYSYLIDADVDLDPSEIASVTWTPSTGLECDTCLRTTAMPFSTTLYQVLVVSKTGCEARETLLLTVDKTRKVYAPNIFSPNEDGTNDVFTIFADPYSVVRIKSLQVYSRWGEQIFEASDITAGDLNTGWDGTFKGEKLNPAVFVWLAVVQFVDGKEELFTGDVTLHR
ncbi:MAG: gliding motility-associated C-terminal domain-containing protein, partial [Saprospiraceae bacterium]